ncbi:MAG: hypothetical protein ACYDHW_14165 [Syntrophorhabdaceae bacterium]
MKTYIRAFMLFVMFFPMALPCGAADDLKTTSDKEATTWSVGSEESRDRARAEEDRDKDRAWDMLQNSSIIIDKRPK